MAEKVNMLTRFQATLVGAVVGDCIGARFEDQWLPYVSWEDLKEELKRLEDTTTNSFPFTDDTAMTRSIAESLAKNNGVVAEDLAKRFTYQFEQEPNRGYGAAVTRIFKKLRQGKFTDVYRPASEQFDGIGSYGNGGAMRIAPVALYACKRNSFTVLTDLCEKVTRLTHTHRMAILGALLQATAINIALNLPPNSNSEEKCSGIKFLDILIQTFSPEEKSHQQTYSDDSYSNKLEKMKDFLKNDTSDPLEVVKGLGNDVSAFGSVPTAIYSFVRSIKPVPNIPCEKPFERSVLYAISMGGDTDTIASMTGAIAGAYYGMDAIPEVWQKGCEGVEEALKEAEELFKLHDIC